MGTRANTRTGGQAAGWDEAVEASRTWLSSTDLKLSTWSGPELLRLTAKLRINSQSAPWR